MQCRQVQFQVACTAATIDGRVVGVAEHRHSVFLEDENRAEPCTAGYIVATFGTHKKAPLHLSEAKYLISLVPER